ncbi:hypothetical protein GF361_00715 [Candidatus Woesearchaeota archaeon]|nr:hypothetical protein [Candidatus Woesearchaeota archaeon]
MFKTAYHYIDSMDWKKVKSSKYLDPDKTEEGYIFCFPDSRRPKEWVENEKFKNAFSDLLKYESGNSPLLCLEIPIEKNDEVYVRDWKYLEIDNDISNKMENDFPYFLMFTATLPVQILMSLRRNKKFKKSVVPLEEYNGNYSLPEIMFANKIKTSRVKNIEEIAFEEITGKIRIGNFP